MNLAITNHAVKKLPHNERVLYSRYRQVWLGKPALSLEVLVIRDLTVTGIYSGRAVLMGTCTAATIDNGKS